MADRETRRVGEIPLEAAGSRLDQALAGVFPEFSRSRLSAWVKSGELLLDGRSAVPRHVVHGGEHVELLAQPDVESGVAAQSIPLDVRYEDEQILVINKPAGLVVHPGAGQRDGTLQNALLHLDPRLAALPRAGIVHRLDKETSGVMVVARTLQAHAALVAQLQAREVHRQYAAVVYGEIIAGATIDAPIGRHPRDRLRQAVVEGPSGKPALTHYRVRERFRAHTLLECRLETGRTHQIRVHLAHDGHPLVGDNVYGSLKLPRGAAPELVEVMRGFRRQALHAEKLEFAHPVTAETVSVSAEWPQDMRDLVGALRLDSSKNLGA